MKEKQEEIVWDLDEKNLDHEKNKNLKAEYLYLKGKALDFSPEF